MKQKNLQAVEVLTWFEQCMKSVY